MARAGLISYTVNLFCTRGPSFYFCTEVPKLPSAHQGTLGSAQSLCSDSGSSERAENALWEGQCWTPTMYHRYWGTSQGGRVDWTATNRSLILLGLTQESVYKQDKARRSRGLPGSGRKSRVQGAKAGRSTGGADPAPPRPGPRPERASVSPPPPARPRRESS